MCHADSLELFLYPCRHIHAGPELLMYVLNAGINFERTVHRIYLLADGYDDSMEDSLLHTVDTKLHFVAYCHVSHVFFISCQAKHGGSLVDDVAERITGLDISADVQVDVPCVAADGSFYLQQGLYAIF